jgi:hypothetical protein
MQLLSADYLEPRFLTVFTRNIIVTLLCQDLIYIKYQFVTRFDTCLLQSGPDLKKLVKNLHWLNTLKFRLSLRLELYMGRLCYRWFSSK